MNAAILKAVQKVKIVQVPGQLRSNGNMSVGYGEAGLYQRRAKTQGHIELTDLAKRHGQVIAAVQELDNGRSVVLDSEYDALVFLPASKVIMDNTYDEGLFLDAFEKLAAEIAEHNPGVEVTCSTPGTRDNPPEGIRDERWTALAEIASEHGVNLVRRFASADLPNDVRNRAVPVADDIQVEMDADTLFLVGSRNQPFASASEARLQVLHKAAEMMLEEFSPSNVVTPLAVGISLAVAEVAIARGIPVTFVAMNAVDKWAPDNTARLEALQASDLVTITGKFEYETGRIQATVRYLNKLATDIGALKVVIDDPVGSEARQVTDAVNLWPQVRGMLNDVGRAMANSLPTAAPTAALASDDINF